MSFLEDIPDLWISRALALVVLVVVAAILSRLVSALVRWFTVRLLSAPSESTDPGRQRRREGLGRIAGWIAGGVVWGIALAGMFVVLGVDVLAFVAGIGFLGVAIVTAAQGPLRDMVAGVMMVADDRLARGDRVRIGELEGVVERIELRTLHLTASDGTPWFISNSSIEQIAVLERAGGGEPAT